MKQELRILHFLHILTMDEWLWAGTPTAAGGFNPCQPHWHLVDVPENYKYSSARFYETGVKDFAFLTHFNDG